MSIKIWIEIDPFRDKQKLLFFLFLLLLLSPASCSRGLGRKEEEIIDLFHTALNSTQTLFAPTLYCCCGFHLVPSLCRALEASSKAVEKFSFPFDGTNIKTSSTLLSGIEANLHVNKTWKQQSQPWDGGILYLDRFLWCLWTAKGASGRQSTTITSSMWLRRGQITLALARQESSRTFFYIAQLSEINSVMRGKIPRA